MSNRKPSKRKAKSHGRKSAGLSRQQLYRIRQNAKGLCAQCPNPLTTYKSLCDVCRDKQSAQQRQRKGYKPWQPGSLGRMPLTAMVNQEAQ